MSDDLPCCHQRAFVLSNLVLNPETPLSPYLVFLEDPRVRAWVPMVGSLLAIPCWVGVVQSGDFYTSLAFLLAEYIVAECWFGPTVTILQEDLPASVRGVGQGIFRYNTPQ